MRAAVNLSVRQLRDAGLVAAIERTLAEVGLGAEMLELELTETAAMDDVGRTMRIFARLRERGVNLSLDDFGAGYANLSYLRSLPFDKLKIDRALVTGVATDANSRAICRALIELAKGLDIGVLGEGVEQGTDVAALRAEGCHVFQGYYFSRPLPPAAFADFARRGHAETVA